MLHFFESLVRSGQIDQEPTEPHLVELSHHTHTFRRSRESFLRWPFRPNFSSTPMEETS